MLLRFEYLIVVLAAGIGWFPVYASDTEKRAYKVKAVDSSAAEANGEDGSDAKRRSSFSSFSLGASFIDYEESTRMQVGGQEVDVETDLGAIPTQSSNAFISIDRQWGFYLFSVSTLGVPQSSEVWEVDERVIRSNKVSFEQQGIGALGSFRHSDISQLLFGAQYSKLEFKRFAAQLAPAATDFDVMEDDFADGTVSEAVWDISVLVGYESGTLFGAGHRGWQYQWRVTLGLPLIMNLSNTEVNEGEVFRESLNGYEVGLVGLAGYRLSKNFLMVGSLQIGVKQRYALDGASFEEQVITAFPGNRTVSVIPTLGAYWSF